MFNKWRNKIKIKQTHSLEGWNGSSSLLIVCTERQESIERGKYFWMHKKKKQKWVQTSQTCFQRGLLKEIFFKFYKVQPLIMLSHNQSLQSITVSSFQVIATIWYDYGVLGFWSLQYGSCHWDFFFFFFKTSVGVTLGHCTTFFSFLMCFRYAIANRFSHLHAVKKKSPLCCQNGPQTCR